MNERQLSILRWLASAPNGKRLQAELDPGNHPYWGTTLRALERRDLVNYVNRGTATEGIVITEMGTELLEVLDRGN